MLRLKEDINRVLLASLLGALTLIFLPHSVPAQSGETQRGVPYLTLRNKTGEKEPNSYYGDGRSDLKAGTCEVRAPDFGILSSAAEAASLRIPEEFVRVQKLREKSIFDVMSTLKQTSAGQTPLLYTHGFYIDFEKGCRRATVFQENTGSTDRFLWFSWPSDGALLNYARDEVDLYWSVPDLAKVIVDMEARLGRGNVNLAGHSLGARGVILALYDIAGFKPDLRVGEVILIAGDIDFEIFQKILPRIRPVARHITIYTFDSDKPLALSAQVHGYPRLGQSGNDVSLLGDVEVIDISDLSGGSPSGHLYHIYSSEVGADIQQLLDHGKRAAARKNLIQIGTNQWRLQPAE